MTSAGVPASAANGPGQGPGNPGPGKPTGRRLALVLGVFVLAIVLGVGAAVVIRFTQDRPPAPPPGPPSPGASAGPSGGPTVPADPLEPMEGPDTGPFAEVAKVAASGTHRVVATTCTGTGVGTAFQFGVDGLLVTSARSVSGARSIAVLTGDRVVPATVAKIDTVSGLALLRPETRLAGHAFELGTRQLAVGDEVAYLGWTTESTSPARGRAKVEVGTISETGVTLESPDGRHPGLRRMNGAFDSGLAGSPVVGADGDLVGVLLQVADDQTDLVVAGLDTIADPLLGPTGMPPAMEPCLIAGGPQIATNVGGPAPTAARTELGQWFGALNAGDWDRARGVLAQGLKGEWSRERLTAEHQGRYAFGIAAAPDPSGTGTLVSWLRLQPDGENRCERLAARMVLGQGGIDRIEPLGDPMPCG